jgi:hypothetical protein
LCKTRCLLADPRKKQRARDKVRPYGENGPSTDYDPATGAGSSAGAERRKKQEERAAKKRKQCQEPQGEGGEGGEAGLAQQQQADGTPEPTWQWDMFIPHLPSYLKLHAEFDAYIHDTIAKAAMCAHCGIVQLGGVSYRHAGLAAGGWGWVDPSPLYGGRKCYT